MPGMEATMSEFKEGTLHSGSKTGPKVTSREQAIAIGMSEKRKAARDHRGKFMSKAIKKAHKEYRDRYGSEDSNPYNSQR